MTVKWENRYISNTTQTWVIILILFYFFTKLTFSKSKCHQLKIWVRHVEAWNQSIRRCHWIKLFLYIKFLTHIYTWQQIGSKRLMSPGGRVICIQVFRFKVQDRHLLSDINPGWTKNNQLVITAKISSDCILTPGMDKSEWTSSYDSWIQTTPLHRRVCLYWHKQFGAKWKTN